MDQTREASSHQAPVTDARESHGARQAYEAPSVKLHGSVAEITKFTGPFLFDGITGSIVICDRALKTGIEAVDPHDILARVVDIPVASWSYRFDEPAIRHIGPMAQEFASAFGFRDTKRIHVVDAIGVAMASIQALHGMIQQRDQGMAQLRTELDALKGRLAT